MMDPPTLPEIRAAAERLREVVVHTPLVPLHNFDHHTDILLKPEIHQAITSFKIRGVFNAVASLEPDTLAKGLSTVSAGNTAQALAWTGRHFAVPSRSVMPDTAPKTKIEAVRNYGGERVLAGNILARQCGTKWHAGRNVGIGNDYTLFALTAGTVYFDRKGRRMNVEAAETN